MEKRSGLSVISWVSAVEGCPLNGVPLYTKMLVDVGLATCNSTLSVARIFMQKQPINRSMTCCSMLRLF